MFWFTAPDQSEEVCFFAQVGKRQQCVCLPPDHIGIQHARTHTHTPWSASLHPHQHGCKSPISGGKRRGAGGGGGRGGVVEEQGGCYMIYNEIINLERQPGLCTINTVSQTDTSVSTPQTQHRRQSHNKEKSTFVFWNPYSVCIPVLNKRSHCRTLHEKYQWLLNTKRIVLITAVIFIYSQYPACHRPLETDLLYYVTPVDSYFTKIPESLQCPVPNPVIK